ncbi:unnamed protein product, partial [marine sediment metagenome]
MINKFHYCLILNFHYVQDPSNPTFKGLNGISEELFHSYIIQLKEHFKILSMSDYISLRDKPGRYCIVTFDDGFINGYNSLFNIFKKEKVPANFFISSRPYLDNEVLNVQKIHLLIGKLGLEEFKQSFYKTAGNLNDKR